MDAFFFPADSNGPVDLYGLGDRCLREPASRRLDGEIYCTLHNVKDFNPLVNDRLLLARERGEVLVQHCSGAGPSWIEVPPFTAELKYAESLLPEVVQARYADHLANQQRISGSSIYPAIQNIILACRALGLGTVITTNHILYEDEVKAVLGMPDNAATFALMPLGYPTGKYGPLTRKPVADVTYADSWGSAWPVATGGDVAT